MSERTEIANIDGRFIQEAQAIADRHSQFTGGYRCLFLIHRHRDGGHTNNSKLRSYISASTDEWVNVLAKLLQEAAQYPELPLRIYQSLNERNVEKAIMHFKHAALDADYYDSESRIGFYLDVRNRFVSALMKPASASTSFFLFDCDTKDESILTPFRVTINGLTKIAHEYPSKSGIHIVTAPFNPTLLTLPDNIELKKDSLMLLKF